MEKQVSSQRGRGGYLEALLNSCPDAVIAIDAEGTITFANKEAAKLTEREMHELVGENIANIYESLEAAREVNRQLFLHDGIIQNRETRARTKTGRLIPVRVSASHLKDATGKVIGGVGYFQVYRPWTAAEAHVKAYAEELEAKLAEWKDLGVSVFELYPGLSVAVIVGPVDASRFERITSNLLGHVQTVTTRVVIIDLSASLLTDASVAGKLIKTVRTIRLLGAECLLTGIQSSIAQALEPLLTEADMVSIKSFCSMDIALDAALGSLGYTICEKE